MFKIGVSSCSKTLDDELFAAYCANNISCIEISERYETYKNLDYGMLKELSEKHSVELWSLHLPFDADIDISNPMYSSSTIEIHKTIIEKATEIGITTFILHPSAEPISDTERQERMSRSKQSLHILAEFAHRRGAVIAVENLPRTCLGKNKEEMLELLSANDGLRACFDTNHLLSGCPVEFIKALGDKMITTHISDYDFINERHWLPGEGCLDWQSIINALREINYNGPWLYELGFEAPNTIDRPKNLTCEDFARNANELFSGLPVTVIGKSKI